MAEAAAEALRDMGAPQGHPNTEGDISATPATQAAQPDRSGAVPPDAGAGAAGAGQELTARQLSAQAIIPGSEFTVESVKHWKGGSISKPGLVELREEVTRRSSGARPAGWDMWKHTPDRRTRGVAKNGPERYKEIQNKHLPFRYHVWCSPSFKF